MALGQTRQHRLQQLREKPRLLHKTIQHHTRRTTQQANNETNANHEHVTTNRERRNKPQSKQNRPRNPKLLQRQRKKRPTTLKTKICKAKMVQRLHQRRSTQTIRLHQQTSLQTLRLHEPRKRTQSKNSSCNQIQTHQTRPRSRTRHRSNKIRTEILLRERQESRVHIHRKTLHRTTTPMHQGRTHQHRPRSQTLQRKVPVPINNRIPQPRKAESTPRPRIATDTRIQKILRKRVRRCTYTKRGKRDDRRTLSGYESQALLKPRLRVSTSILRRSVSIHRPRNHRPPTT